MKFIDIIVDSHPELPEGLCLRWKADGEPVPVRALLFEPDDGPDGVWTVVGVGPDGESAAQAVTVNDSSAGISTLVWGGAHGLLLRLTTDPTVLAREPYLLLAPDQIVQ